MAIWAESFTSFIYTQYNFCTNTCICVNEIYVQTRQSSRHIILNVYLFMYLVKVRGVLMSFGDTGVAETVAY